MFIVWCGTSRMAVKKSAARSASSVINSHQVTMVGSFTRPKPWWLFASHSETTPPVGSRITAIRPTSITSIGGRITVPPAAATFATAALASSTAM
ncbi:MAG: hypothetical protein DWI59_01305 [Chloroflexi bacterium]|nr:MAG: hypothetical protein DWI59_01305 [Chloroflexota bacterium]